jgi:prepilin-type N-terminal cleavage/methylation domain-containing protein
MYIKMSVRYINRKAFTLIELMIVIAIIIILASIAIPVYAKLITRARRARVIGDFRTLQTSLEAYKTDWGTYPVTGANGETFGYNTDYSSPTSTITKELTGESATLNTSSNVTSTGEIGGIDYFTRKWIIRRMKNPFNSSKDYEYYSEDGSSYVFACEYKDGATVHYILKGIGINYKDVTVKPSWYVDQ